MSMNEKRDGHRRAYIPSGFPSDWRRARRIDRARRKRVAEREVEREMMRRERRG